MQISIMKIILDYAWGPWIISSSCLWTEILRGVYRFESQFCIVSAIYLEVTVLPLLVDGNIITVCLLPRVIYSNPLFMAYSPTDWEAAKRREGKTKTEDVKLKQSNYVTNLYTVYSTTILSGFHYCLKLKFLYRKFCNNSWKKQISEINTENQWVSGLCPSSGNLN
jgi:hypothetical protein